MPLVPAHHYCMDNSNVEAGNAAYIGLCIVLPTWMFLFACQTLTRMAQLTRVYVHVQSGTPRPWMWLVAVG
jgi:hypothetical protein